MLTSELGYYSRKFGPEVLLQLNLAYYLPSIPVLVLSSHVERAMDDHFGRTQSMLLRLVAGLLGCALICAAFPFLPSSLEWLLGTTAVIGAPPPRRALAARPCIAAARPAAGDAALRRLGAPDAVAWCCHRRAVCCRLQHLVPAGGLVQVCRHHCAGHWLRGQRAAGAGDPPGAGHGGCAPRWQPPACGGCCRGRCASLGGGGAAAAMQWPRWCGLTRRQERQVAACSCCWR
jgi:hypothetical protein